MIKSLSKKAFTNFEHVYQICYNEETRKKGFHGFQPVENKALTPFFENSVIEKLPLNVIPARAWVGVLSPRFWEKIGIRFIGGINGEKLDNFLSETDKDVVSFFPQMTNKNIITQAENYHKGYIEAFKMILVRAGIDYDIRKRSRVLFRHDSGHFVYPNIFQNHVIARKEVYERYINEVLRPCMEAMEDKSNTEIQEIIWKDSGYYKLANRKQRAKPEYLEACFGVPYYPYHTFICERFWTLFMNMNKDISMTHYPFL